MRSGKVLMILSSVIASLISISSRNPVADSRTFKPIISGLRNGTPEDRQFYKPGSVIPLAIFGQNLHPADIEHYYLSDADRCGDIEVMDKQKFQLVADLNYIDNFTIIANTTKPIPSSIKSVLRLCHTHADPNKIALKTWVIHPEEPHQYFIPYLWICVLYSATLLFSALLSGLNLAYSCVKEDDIAREKYKGSKGIKARLYNYILSHINWLIATFALSNTVVNIISTLLAEQIFFEFSDKVLYLNTIPVILTMVIGEILPQAISYRNSKTVADVFVYFVGALLIMPGIFAWPLGQLLDYVLGQEPVRVYDVQKLKALLDTHTRDNKELVRNVLNFHTITAGKVMTRIQDAYLMSKNDILDVNRMVGILEKGYTRVPIFEGLDRTKIVGVLNTKDLMLIDPDDKKFVFEALEEFPKFKKKASTMEIRFVSHEMPAHEVMNEMVKGKQHLMMVFKYAHKTYSIAGLVTLEDIIEEFVGEIKDDDDAAFQTMRAGARRDQSTFDWFRSENDKKTNLTANESLKLIQQIVNQCPFFTRVNFHVYAMRALINSASSKIETIKKTEDKKVILEKGAPIKDVYVILNGSITCGGFPVLRERPVFGNELLEQLYQKILIDGDKADIKDLETVIKEEVCLVSQQATILNFRLKTIFRILLVLNLEKMNEDVIPQADVYMHIKSVINNFNITPNRNQELRASMEDKTQQLDIIPSIGIAPEPAMNVEPSPQGGSKDKDKVTTIKKLPFLNPKLEQRTQALSSPTSSKSKRSKKMKKIQVVKKVKTKTQSVATPPTAAPDAVADISEKSDILPEDNTQHSSDEKP